jgi:mono/diheme cytochrome c family protein
MPFRLLTLTCITSQILGCATLDQLAPPVPAILAHTPIADEQTIASMEAGRHLYITRCARCHSPEAVTAYTRDEWRTILPRMALETDLTPGEERAVAAYVEGVLGAAAPR